MCMHFDDNYHNTLVYVVQFNVELYNVIDTVQYCDIKLVFIYVLCMYRNTDKRWILNIHTFHMLLESLLLHSLNLHEYLQNTYIIHKYLQNT